MTDKNDFGKKIKRLKRLRNKVKKVREKENLVNLKKRKPSAYNMFFKTEMPKVKKEFPNMEHSKVFKEVTKRWKEKQAKKNKK